MMKFVQAHGVLVFVAACLLALGLRPSTSAAETPPTPGKKIAVTMLGEVVTKGKITLPSPATMDDAFAGAGGFNRDDPASARRAQPAKFCILMTRTNGVDENMHVSIKIDVKTRVIRVIDDAWKKVRLKDGDTLIVPVITRR